MDQKIKDWSEYFKALSGLGIDFDGVIKRNLEAQLQGPTIQAYRHIDSFEINVLSEETLLKAAAEGKLEFVDGHWRLK